MFEWRADKCPLCDGPASSTLVEGGNARRYCCTDCTDFIATRLACRELAGKPSQHRQLMAHQARWSGRNEMTRLSMEDGLQRFKKTLVAARIPRPVTWQGGLQAARCYCSHGGVRVPGTAHSAEINTALPKGNAPHCALRSLHKVADDRADE